MQLDRFAAQEGAERVGGLVLLRRDVVECLAQRIAERSFPFLDDRNRDRLAIIDPLSRANAPVPKPTVAPRVLVKGDICPKCKAEVRDRPLLNRSYLGCLC